MRESMEDLATVSFLWCSSLVDGYCLSSQVSSIYLSILVNEPKSGVMYHWLNLPVLFHVKMERGEGSAHCGSHLKLLEQVLSYFDLLFSSPSCGHLSNLLYYTPTGVIVLKSKIQWSLSKVFLGDFLTVFSSTSTSYLVPLKQ